MKKLFLIYTIQTGAFVTLIEDYEKVEKAKEAKAKGNNVQLVYISEEIATKITDAKTAKKKIWIQENEPIENEGLILIRDGAFLFDKSDLEA